jgi:DNA-binding CsgD family transcriptional regulator
MGARGLVATIEAAYRLVDDDVDWLRGICEAAMPLLDGGFGVVGWMFDPSQPAERWQSSPVAVGANPGFCDAVLRTGKHMPLRDLERMYLYSPGVGTMRDMLGVRAADEYSPSSASAAKLGVRDFLGVRALDPSFGGCFFGAPLAQPAVAKRSFVSTWGRVSAHIAAGLRLRRALAGGAPEAHADAAILDARGTVHHAEGAAKTSRNLEALRSAARAMHHARSAGQSETPAALSQWQALTAGTWSLVDRFESDGQRFLVARANAPDAPDPRALSRGERVICRYIGAGHSNKLIAYSLGVSEGTVAAHAASAFRKLGVRSRVELVRLLAEGADARTAELDVGGVRLVVHSDGGAKSLAELGLTRAEQEVASLAVVGKSNADIAAHRRCSERTVANLAQAVYRKLGVSSRAELAALLLQSPATAE